MSLLSAIGIFYFGLLLGVALVALFRHQPDVEEIEEEIEARERARWIEHGN